MIHKFSRYLLTLVALFAMTAGAWADGTVYKSGQSVRIVDLKVGDIILPGATVTRDGMSTPTIQKLKFRRCTTEWVDMSESLPVTFDENAGLGDYHVGGKPLQPIDENGNVGNAWQVAVLTLEPFGYIATLDGITYRDPNAPVISEDGTEAEFEMPAYDATLEYDIVRNLASNMTLNLFIGEEAVTADARLRIAKNEQTGKYAPVSPLSCALVDKSENKTLTPQQIIAAGITPTFYLLDEDEEWQLVTSINQQTMLPADILPNQTYRMVLKAADDAPLYGGETLPSFSITLFEGYPVEIAAGEFATFYSADPVYAENEGVQFYTITSVSGDKAMLSEPFDTAPSNTPVFVYNSTEETQSVLLIPTNEPNLALDYYEGFVGTAEATTIAASDEISDQYAFNGKQFVWVMNELPVAANKCWLEMPKSSNAKYRAITLVFDETTGLKAVDSGQLTDDTWYDLNGRKLSRKPTTKGVYIWKGKKVVVR